jgi:hypothetical protein
MRYIALLKAAPPSSPQPPGLMEAIGKLGEEATKAGVLVDPAGLAPALPEPGSRSAKTSPSRTGHSPALGTKQLRAVGGAGQGGGGRVDHPLHADPPRALGGLGRHRRRAESHGP